MKLIYDPLSLEYNFQEKNADGNYRLDGVEKVAERVHLESNVEKDILRVHSQTLLKKIKGHCKTKVRLAEILPDEKTLPAIYSSVRQAIKASQEGLFALTRPPGHHASRDVSEGFCFLNNIAIAAQKLIDSGKRVCIIDIDGHHGNGTEKIFYKNPHLLLCSVFQDRSYASRSGDITRIGYGEAKGLNLNLPVPPESGDDILLGSLEFFKKQIDRFKPDVIGVSAGFDGYFKDRLLDLNYSVAGYMQFGFNLSRLGYPIFAVLEGGYHEDVLICAKSFVEGVNGKQSKPEELTYSTKEVLARFNLNIGRLEGKLNELGNL
ncbi:MAG: histone deacetylase family protein [Candidatus Pacearchaeota archaeon]